MQSLIKKGAPVQAIKAGNYFELRYLKHRNTQAPIQKLDADHFVVLATGEIKEFSHEAKSRIDNIRNLKKSFNELRYRVHANFSGARNELWITLTYKENMRDEKRLSDDFRMFIKRLNRFMFGRNAKMGLDYIMVPEPQGRGAWHAHILMKRKDGQNFFIENGDLAKIWGHGFVTVRRISESTNVANYLVSYLGDLPLNEAQNLEIPFDDDAVKEVQVEGQSKKFVKGARLFLYPKGMQYFRASAGIVKPEKYMTRKKEIEIEPTYSYEHEFQIDEETDQLVQVEQYNFAAARKAKR